MHSWRLGNHHFPFYTPLKKLTLRNKYCASLEKLEKDFLTSSVWNMKQVTLLQEISLTFGENTVLGYNIEENIDLTGVKELIHNTKFSEAHHSRHFKGTWDDEFLNWQCFGRTGNTIYTKVYFLVQSTANTNADSRGDDTFTTKWFKS